MIDAALSPLMATLIFITGCLAGFQFRRTWAREGPRWMLWLFGIIAGGALLTVGFIPLDVR